MTATQTLDDRRRTRRPRSCSPCVVLAIAAMWVYVLFIGQARPPNRFGDTEWAQRAEPVCAAVAAELEALPPARSFAAIEPVEEALRQRADVGEQATDLLAEQAGPPASAAVSRRATPTASCSRRGSRTGTPTCPTGAITSRAGGPGRTRPSPRPKRPPEGRSANRMDALAKENGMPSCVVPLDFG